MAFVIAEPCIDVKDGICVDVCPVDCIYEGGRMLYIHPDECINCALCQSVCPVDAIFSEEDLPEDLERYAAVNREFFGPRVTGWGAPGGLSDSYRTDIDHPVVEAVAANSG